MIIHSTTLDTEEKVKTIYGGTSWTKIEGRFLLGQSDNYAINSVGGEEKHTLTTSEMPPHNHIAPVIGGQTSGQTSGSWTARSVSDLTNANVNTKNAGGGAAHNNMPPYKTVYIWERTA